MEQEKEIVISSLSSKEITPKPGATWRAFTVFMILANDGITYETTDREFYSKRIPGEKLIIKYKVETKTSGGKVYTSHKIITKADPMAGAMTEIMKRMNAMEKNILAAIELTRGSAVIPDTSVTTVDEPIVDDDGNY